ncbi:hypothetical protein [Streptomyces chromofuscus]|uniref:hypothetical protein n=1 Tax=Streptomyces chromofuscus TaxID=42881 RepID=UPI0019AEFF4B|nr:hypothetical protein [Streptomyces chromofuscus]GGT15359.1 hypothetical protein GCM10010254_39870 [Streptomyces chromofuscus]
MSGAADADGDRRAEALANEVEGYLIACVERDGARREAAELCARLPWLTAAQAEDLTRHHIEQRLDVTRGILLRSARRGERLHKAYEARYAELRRTLLKRHAACACALLACAGGIVAAAWTAGR